MAGNVAFVEDFDDDEGSSLEGVQGTRRYAISEAPVTPTTERPNTSKSRGSDRPPGRRGHSSSSSGSGSRSSKSRDGSYDRDDIRHQKELNRQRREEDRRNRDRYNRESEIRRVHDEHLINQMPPPKPMKKPRPAPPKHAMSQPVIEQGSYRRGHVDDPRYFGVQQTAISGPPRPRNTRPASYYAGQPPRPPMPGMNWQHPPPPGPFPVGTFPPPMGPGGLPSGMPGHCPPPMSPMGPPPDFYDGPPHHPPPAQSSRALRNRFERPVSDRPSSERPSSAMGFGASPSQRSYMPDEYGYDDDSRHSTSRPPRSRRQQDDDRKAMPPPPPQYKSIPRSQTAAPRGTQFGAPPPARPISRQGKPSRPPPAHRRSIGYGTSPGYYDEDDFQGEDHLFQEVSPEPKHDPRRQALTRARRDSVIYDDDDYDIVPARTRGRRASMYGHGELGSGGVSLDESKYLGALQYQEDITGGSPMPLTAEVLKRANSRRDIASSRSTRSSASRDESDYKRSNTTGLTQSSSGNEDNRVTITGTTKVYLADGTEIECHDGSITLSGGGVRLGSDSGTVYQLEESRSRFKALPHRARAPSQSDAASRYAPSRAPYSYHDYDPSHDASFDFDDDDDDDYSY
ncbi:hypothetical protein N3K66_008007 [Trichothecium roseum]|uniref:Uncharacterized protein n=1 Tax=Trichothecium roseum TaxID=47278 RepID=A0ACC0UTD5_9HYPO|nr:hypothetical protein N3K66_008007 [Trichothecium roseum]